MPCETPDDGVSLVTRTGNCVEPLVAGAHPPGLDVHVTCNHLRLEQLYDVLRGQAGLGVDDSIGRCALPTGVIAERFHQRDEVLVDDLSTVQVETMFTARLRHLSLMMF